MYAHVDRDAHQDPEYLLQALRLGVMEGISALHVTCSGMQGDPLASTRRPTGCGCFYIKSSGGYGQRGVDEKHFPGPLLTNAPL
jgi:hypothetical protein